MSSDKIINTDSANDKQEAITTDVDVINDLKNKIQQLESELDEVKRKACEHHIELLKNAPVIIPITQFLIMAKDQAMHHKISEANIQLPNASEGKDYHVIFDTEKLGFPEIKYVEFPNLKQYGLHYDSSAKTIAGIPNKSGEFTVKLRYKNTEESAFIETHVSLTINADPRSLWKDLPSNKEDKYCQPDSDQRVLPIEANKKIVVASQRGRSHAQEGKFRDDHFDIYHNEISKWSVVVVADGAGSAKYSRRGSLVACNEIINYFKALTEEQITVLETAIVAHQTADSDNQAKKNLTDLLYEHLAGSAFEAHKKIKQEAIENESIIKDYATTLMFSIFKKYDFGWFVASWGVGDSPMGIYIAEQEPIIMHQPEEGEYSGQTYFLTMSDIFKRADRFTYKFIEDFTAIVLMTDGIYDPKFQTRTNLGKTELWAELWHDLKEQINFSPENEQLSGELLKWLDFWSPGNHDDRTIAIIF